MKKLLILILIFFSGAVNAEWKLVANNNDYTNAFYVDSKSIEKKGNYLRAWILVDYTAIDKFGNHSHKFLQEFDCDGRVRALAFIPYSGKMGSGKAGEQLAPEPKWYFSTPGDINSLLVKYVCQSRWD